MNYRRQSRLGVASLTARNEGKLKSYASCNDVRAWSHDLEARDRYLREWIKSDMPSVSYPNIIITPQCHPDCKSKVVLDSICTSCHAMRDCLKNDNTFKKYFEEEEFETCHWRCERCLDALKNIKMLWKVIVEKVFRIRVPKNDEPTHGSSVCTDSVRSTADTWRAQMVHHAWVVKNLMPFEGDGIMKTCQCHRSKSVRLDPCISTRTFTIDDRPKSGHSVRSNLTKLRDDEPIPILVGSKPRRQRKGVHRYISVRSKTADVGCDTCDLYKVNDERGANVNNLNFLEQRYDALKIEMERLKRENSSLKFELQNFYNGFSLKSHLCSSTGFSAASDVCLIPKPFDCIEESGEVPEQPVKNADSEMIITMKNCHNPNYKNVSLLQVFHKSNEPTPKNPAESACRTEDPVNLLARMQDVFGAIVRREISIVTDKKRNRTKISDIDASFHRVTVSKSVPSCSTLGSPSNTSMFHCV